MEISVVSENAADLGGGQEYEFRFLLGEKLLYGGLLAQVDSLLERSTRFG